MARKPENNWIDRVNKYVDSTVHREKMANPFRRGTADVWYSGTAKDLWVEYKWIPTLPVRAFVDPSKLLEPLQRKWMLERYREGRNVAVCIGCPHGGVITIGAAWGRIMSADEYRHLLCQAKVIGDMITTYCKSTPLTRTDRAPL